MPEKLTNCLILIIGLLMFGLVLIVLGSPIGLAIIFPASADAITAIAKTLIPWVAIIYLLLTFHEGIKQIFNSISAAILGVTKLRAGNAEIEFGRQQGELIQLSTTEAKQIEEGFKKLEQAKQVETAWAWNYFLKYVAVTIYGSQVQLLQRLKDKGPQKKDDLAVFYKAFLVRAPGNAGYSFESYLNYLSSNFLINYNAETDKYEISQHGNHFLTVLKDANLSSNSFPA